MLKITDKSGMEYFTHDGGHAEKRLKERVPEVPTDWVKKPVSHKDWKNAQAGKAYNYILQSADGRVQAPIIQSGGKLFIKTFIYR